MRGRTHNPGFPARAPSWALVALAAMACSAQVARPADGTGPVPLNQGWEVHWPAAGESDLALAQNPSGVAWEPVKLGTNPRHRQGRTEAWYRVRLPPGSWADPAVLLTDIELQLEGYVGGKLIYRYGNWSERSQRRPTGASWFLLRLPPDFGGRDLLLHLHSNSPVAIGPDGATLGSRSDLLEGVVTAGIPGGAIALLILAMGIIALGVFVRRPDEMAYAAFAAVAFSRGLSLLASADLRLLISPNAVLWAYLLVLSRLFMPAAFLAFVETVLRPGRWMRWIWWGALGVGLLLCPALLVDFVPVYGLAWIPLNGLVLLAMGLATVLAVRAALRKQRDGWILIVGLLAFTVAVVHDLLVNVHLALYPMQWSPIGDLAVICALALVLLGRFARVHEALRVHAAELELKNQQLESTRQALDKAVRSRDEFLSIASHELKTPLTSMFLQLARLERQGSGARPDYAPIRRQLLRLGRLTESLLDVTRLQGGRLQLRREPVDLSQLVREVVDRARDEATAAGSELNVRTCDAVPGELDAERVDQVVTNLVINAIKYGQGRPIEVDVGQQEGRAMVMVTDHGMGIAPEDRARIFERFERAAGRQSRFSLGLGLWISRGIVEAHGGQIRVESEPGRGSTFIVELPLRSG